MNGAAHASPVCLNLAFKGDLATAGAMHSNLWLFDTWRRDQKTWNLNDPESQAHFLYCAFPGMKDPEHEHGPQQKLTGECVTFVDRADSNTWIHSAHKQRETDLLAVGVNFIDSR